MNPYYSSKEILTVKKIRLLEEKAKQLGLKEQILIENASSSLISVIDNLNFDKNVLVIAGRGNNGADVLSCARKLAAKKYKVVVAVLEEKPLGKQAFFQKKVLEKIKIPVYSFNESNINDIKIFLKDKCFILDGILGIGVKYEVSDFYKKTIRLINDSDKPVVACDIPSGLDPDKGIVLGAAVKADYTVSFIAYKKGFFINQGPNYTGTIIIADIGISKEALSEVI
ncbi:MAG: NAD(P)H-hydrate epimerase [Candidatus Omnitrophica bacterium]|nr:NAD(P)H-hydrate epimerase [Candidatus Omnitrophota bacterium]MCK5491893.1 NAD(P)H-hydrate epimerase [Candidatus Omnitrophota bacterium]